MKTTFCESVQISLEELTDKKCPGWIVNALRSFPEVNGTIIIANLDLEKVLNLSENRLFSWLYGNGFFDEGIFEGYDFSEVDLSERDFEGVSFRHCLFRRSNLKKANFKNASFERAIFRGCTLDNASFESANVSQSCFSWNSIRNANFSNVDLGSIFLVENTAFNLAVGVNKELSRKFRS